MAKSRLIGEYPVIGIRPVIDARRGPLKVREGLEDQTMGMAKAAAKLVERLGGTVVKMLFPIELEGFKAREGILKGYDVDSLVKYPGK